MNRTIVFLHARLRELRLKRRFRGIEPAFRRHMVRGVESLPDLQHEVLRLIRFEGCSCAQAANRLGLTEREVETHLILALEILWRSIERQARKGW